jgi:hypothetical protein
VTGREHGQAEGGAGSEPRRTDTGPESWNRQGDPTYLGDLHDEIAHMRLFLQSIASADPQTEQAEWMVETATKGLRSPTTEEQVGSGHDEQTEGPQSVFAGPTQGTRPAPHVRPGFKPDPRTVAARTLGRAFRVFCLGRRVMSEDRAWTLGHSRGRRAALVICGPLLSATEYVTVVEEARLRRAEAELEEAREALAEAGGVLLALLLADRTDEDEGRPSVHAPEVREAMRQAERRARGLLEKGDE